MVNYQILQGDCRETLAGLPDGSVHCVVTSPPYFGLRNYNVDGQIGLEQTPDEYVAQMVAVFREVRRVLRSDGTLWLNLGDSYAGGGGFSADAPSATQSKSGKYGLTGALKSGGIKPKNGLKPKDLIGIPWRVAFALQADGWWLRQDIIWAKPNPMPESVRDRCTKAHEYIFLLSKSAKYYFDSDAIAEPATYAGKTVTLGEKSLSKGQATGMSVVASGNGKADSVLVKDTRNRRSVWTVSTKPYSEAHFATFPPDLIEPCILAGCPEGGTVLDPFGGSGTTAMVALKHRRNAILCELNPEYIELIHKRCAKVQPQLLQAIA